MELRGGLKYHNELICCVYKWRFLKCLSNMEQFRWKGISAWIIIQSLAFASIFETKYPAPVTLNWTKLTERCEYDYRHRSSKYCYNSHRVLIEYCNKRFECTDFQLIYLSRTHTLFIYLLFHFFLIAVHSLSFLVVYFAHFVLDDEYVVRIQFRCGMVIWNLP